jgi:plasmid stabilization system protein ParE
LAAADLAEIWAFIAADSPAAAHAFVQQITGKFEPLRQFPSSEQRANSLLPGCGPCHTAIM